mgnify:CR=1 FL=1
MENVLVTGGTKGLGLSIVKQILENTNYKIITAGRTKTPEIERLQEEYKERAFFYEIDLSITSQLGDFINRITNEHGSLYGLINNAAIGLDGVLATQHNKDIANMMAVNLEAPIILSKYACRGMLAKQSGRIINISSIIASTGFNGLAVYGATKSGLEGFTRSLSRELGRKSITVNSVAPGYMETEMTSGLQGSKLDSIKKRAPLGLPTTDDVASVVLFLLSDKAQKITGAIYKVDGGSTA